MRIEGELVIAGVSQAWVWTQTSRTWVLCLRLTASKMGDHDVCLLHYCENQVGSLETCLVHDASWA